MLLTLNWEDIRKRGKAADFIDWCDRREVAKDSVFTPVSPKDWDSNNTYILVIYEPLNEKWTFFKPDLKILESKPLEYWR